MPQRSIAFSIIVLHYYIIVSWVETVWCANFPEPCVIAIWLWLNYLKKGKMKKKMEKVLIHARPHLEPNSRNVGLSFDSLPLSTLKTQINQSPPPRLPAHSMTLKIQTCPWYIQSLCLVIVTSERASSSLRPLKGLWYCLVRCCLHRHQLEIPLFCVSFGWERIGFIVPMDQFRVEMDQTLTKVKT